MSDKQLPPDQPDRISPFRDPLHPTEEERQVLKDRLTQTRQPKGRGTANTRGRSNGFQSVGDSLQGAQEVIARRIQRNRELRQREAEERAREAAAFDAAGGDCFACRDEGPCEECDRGRLEAEHEREQQRRLRALELLKDIPPRCQRMSMDTFPFNGSPAYNPVLDAIGEWNPDRGLILLGPCGTGKTGLIVGILREVAHRWAANPANTHRIRFLTCAGLMQHLRAGYDDRDREGAFDERLYQLMTVRLLAIDDLGAERPTPWGLEQLFTIINHRYEWDLPTLITTNYSLDELARRIGERVVERLIETSIVVDLGDCPNLREWGRR